jgi:small subunit ribosomal protein S2
MAVITMRQMLEAGAHFGHQTRRWNPKMKPFIFGERNGIYIIDLEQTLGRVDAAYGFVRDLVANGGTILFVGTKKQAQDPVRSYAEKCGMPYVNERWLGGMLTNFETISKRVGKMLDYERMQQSGEFDVMIKKEALLLERELTKLQRNLGGLRSLKTLPQAIFVLDTNKEHIAVTEANKLGIPVVAVVDTNVDPELVQYPIPGNDDAIRSNSLFARVIADAVEEGRYIANKRNPAPAAPEPRSAEDEAAFEAEQAAARAAAAQAQADRDARLAAAKTQPTAAEEAPADQSAPTEPAHAASDEAGAAPAADAAAPVAPAAEPPADTATSAADAAAPPAEAPAADAPAPAAEVPAADAPAPAAEVPAADAPAPAAEDPAADAPAPAAEDPAAEPPADTATPDADDAAPAPAAEVPAADAPAPAAEVPADAARAADAPADTDTTETTEG